MAVADLGFRDLDQQVLALVAELVSELNGGTPQQPSLDDSLERDLGISSLERVELLLRLERTFGVRLSDDVMAEAATAHDLVKAILAATPGAPETPSATRYAGAAPTSVPTSARSLVDVLRWHAERTPDRVHIYLRHDDGHETPVTYGELASAAAEMAAGLREAGVVRGDRVALVLRTERAFFESFAATLLAGAVPVPLYPPIRTEDLVTYASRQRAVLRNAEPRVLVTFGEAERLATLMQSHVPSLALVTTSDRLHGKGTHTIPERPAAEDPALIQYTSGSTGVPKGVLLSNANILANIRAIGRALDIGADDVGVSWLPLYHDMGLIGMWLGSLYFGAPAAIMSPLAFLARPSRWLWALHAHGGTISAAPNFAFDLCAKRVTDEELNGLDLSRWRVAINGAEAVNPDTIDRFVRRFAPYGFRPEAMCPAYGMAESSVALTVSSPQRPPRIDAIAREPFQERREIRPAAQDEPGALRLVSSGSAVADHDIRIADESDRVVGERIEGHVQFRGPSVTRGYFRNAGATSAAQHDGWMESGDFGYLADGDLFITGREKDLIIKGGRNISAEEVETLTSEVPGIRPHSVAAFGAPDQSTGTERFVVVAETKATDPAQQEQLRRAVREQLANGIGLPPDLIVLTPPHTVLKTSSGKIRRSAMRDAYMSGSIAHGRRSMFAQRVWLVAGATGARLTRAGDLIGRTIFTAWVLLLLVTTLPILAAYLAFRRPGRAADRAAKRWSRFALRVTGLSPRVIGLEHLQTLGSAVLVANHASYIDPIIVMAAIPIEFRFLAKAGLADYPVIGTVIRKAQHIPIEKVTVSTRLAGAQDVAQRLREGERLLIFPEGTFRNAPGLLPFRLGAFRAAADAARPVVPIAIGGARSALSADSWLLRHGTITVTIGAPLAPTGTGWPEIVRLRDGALAHIRPAVDE